MGKADDAFLKQASQSNANEGGTDKEEVMFGEEKVLCRRVDMLKEYQEAFKTADSYRKVGKVDARQATEREEISTSQDGMKNYAEAGDWIIKNPGDKDPYVFGDKNDPIETRQAKFAKKYEIIPGEEGQFRPKGIIKAVKTGENIVFDTSWGEKMAAKKGGWIADGGYAIAEESFKNTYEKVEAPKKKGDKVLCHINGKDVKGVIFSDDMSGGNLIAIKLEENIGSKYLSGYGTTLGYEMLKDASKIEKIGEVSNKEMEEVLDEVNNLSWKS